MGINYQDIASAAMGGTASQTAPTFQQASFNTMKQLGMNQYNRDQLGRDFARTSEDYGRRFEDTARALPGQFNRRGMIDSGQYQRGANRAMSDNLRGFNRAAEDYNQGIERSRLSDDILMGDLSNLRSQLNSQEYQALVASMVGRSGGAA